MSNYQTLRTADFEAVFASPLSTFVAERIEKYQFAFQELTHSERDACLRRVVSVLLDSGLLAAGAHRQGQWEQGWGENLEKYGQEPQDRTIIPGYFGKYGIVRWKQRFVQPISPDFEYNMLGVIQDWLFDQYLREAEAIYEFGCGTGHNLLRLREINGHAKLWGLDWAHSSQELIQRIAANRQDKRLFARHFDYFEPDLGFALEPGACLYTVASLEQIGDRFGAFVDYVLANRPKLVIHIEPIAELLNPDELVDFLSIEYFKKRNYLRGYLDYLRKLEMTGKIAIHRAQRTFIGSLFIEGYSVVVWSPT